MTFEEYLEQRFFIGKVPVPRSAECRHFFIVGRSGTGKTRLIYSLIDKIRKQKAKALIYDFKGDYVSCFYDSEKDFIFNPLDRRTLHWSLFSEIETHADVDAVASSLIPLTSKEDKFWVDGARDIFASIIHYLKRMNLETNQAIWDHVSLSEGEMLSLMQTSVNQGIEAAKRALGYLQGHDKGSKVASDVLSTMRQYTNCFYYTRHLASNFSIKSFIESEESSFLFLVGYSKLRDTLKPLLSLFIDTTIRHVLSLHENYNRRIYLVIDEFVTLQKLSSILQGLEQGRSKGLSLIIALQDFNQLERVYRESAFSILNNCSTIVCFAVNDPRSAEVMSKTFGETEILETDESLSMGPEDLRDGLSLQRRRKVEKLILPSQIASLQDLTAYLKMLHYPVAKVRIPFVPSQEKNIAVDLNPIFKFDLVNNNIETKIE
jgi:type IV secretory pathway TraG/TraD family ATPase VirD4